MESWNVEGWNFEGWKVEGWNVKGLWRDAAAVHGVIVSAETFSTYAHPHSGAQHRDSEASPHHSNHLKTQSAPGNAYSDAAHSHFRAPHLHSAPPARHFRLADGHSTPQMPLGSSKMPVLA